MCLCAAGGVTNTAQYQNRLMVYDPEQVTDESFYILIILEVCLLLHK